MKHLSILFRLSEIFSILPYRWNSCESRFYPETSPFKLAFWKLEILVLWFNMTFSVVRLIQVSFYWDVKISSTDLTLNALWIQSFTLNSMLQLNSLLFKSEMMLLANQMFRLNEEFEGTPYNSLKLIMLTS